MEVASHQVVVLVTHQVYLQVKVKMVVVQVQEEVDLQTPLLGLVVEQEMLQRTHLQIMEIELLEMDLTVVF